MDKTPLFGEGLFFSRPRDGAPDFIKGSLSIEPSKLIKFLKVNVQHLSPKGWMNLDLKESKGGSLYFQVNTWKPLKKPEELEQDKITEGEQSSDEVNPEDVPF